MATTANCLVILLLLVSLLSSFLCDGKKYIVGDDEGWALGVDYKKWAKGKEFFVGDTLVFNRGDDESHTVIVVTKSAATDCVPQPNTGAFDVGIQLTLTAAGPLGFICSVDDHCDQGMKLVITVKPSLSQGASLSPVVKPPLPAAAAPSTY